MINTVKNAFNDAIETMRQEIKSYAISKRLDARLGGDDTAMTRWENITDFFRKAGDVPTKADLRESQIKDVITGLRAYPHDHTDRDQAIQNSIDYLAFGSDNDPITVEEVYDYLAQFDTDTRAKILPDYDEETLTEVQALQREEGEGKAKLAAYMGAHGQENSL